MRRSAMENMSPMEEKMGSLESALPSFASIRGDSRAGATVKLSESTPINCIIQLKKLSAARGTNLESLIKADPDIFWARFHGGCAGSVTNTFPDTFGYCEVVNNITCEFSSDENSTGMNMKMK